MGSYTPEQLAQIETLPSAVILAAMMVEVHGPIAAFREVAAGMKFIHQAKTVFPNNALIQGVPEDASLATSHAHHIEVSTTDERAAARAKIQAEMDAGLALLADDVEAYEFKAFLVHIAEKVIEAAGSGLFGSGERISPAEQTFVQTLKQRLSVVS